MISTFLMSMLTVIALLQYSSLLQTEQSDRSSVSATQGLSRAPSLLSTAIQKSFVLNSIRASIKIRLLELQINPIKHNNHVNCYRIQE